MSHYFKSALLFILLIGSSGCENEVDISNDYSVIQLDNSWNVAHKLERDCSIGRIMNVTAVGWHKNYIYGVSEQQYFWFDTIKDHRYLNAEDIVHGPISKPEFDRIMDSLGISDIEFQLHFPE